MLSLCYSIMLHATPIFFSTTNPCNTTKLLNVTCTLAATNTTLQSLECNSHAWVQRTNRGRSLVEVGGGLHMQLGGTTKFKLHYARYLVPLTIQSYKVLYSSNVNLTSYQVTSFIVYNVHTTYSTFARKWTKKLSHSLNPNNM